MSPSSSDPVAGLVLRSAASGVGHLIADKAVVMPNRPAVDDGRTVLDYATLDDRARRLAGVMAARGVGQGDRIAVLAENRLEWCEIFVAVAYLGAIAACQNWRLSRRELDHCIELVEPKLTIVSERHAGMIDQDMPHLLLGADYEAALLDATPLAELAPTDPEDPMLVLYTSGTTGLPKGAVLSHRAEIARSLVIRAEFGIAIDDTFVAWSPLYHMGAAEGSIGAMMSGGKVIVVDGLDHDRLCEVISTERLGWLLLMPGMVGQFADQLEARGIKPMGIKVCGVMADLVPLAEIARITGLLNAPYANTFGATETGCPPCSSSLLAAGEVPTSLSKRQSPYCQVRLVDPDDNDVVGAQPGELIMRGPTLFSGYWRAAEVNAEEFRGGWFHMGDVFRRNPDGTLDFVDRVKYLIKSGGENIYPAEIERILLSDARIIDAAVVRAGDERWGEVPVAFVAVRDAAVSPDELYKLCRASLAGYKQPKGIIFMAAADFPRNATGKILRHVLEGQVVDHEIHPPVR
jgi:acyl-CoA synthetase (AMP-forming)/AMP-acid ligase II